MSKQCPCGGRDKCVRKGLCRPCRLKGAVQHSDPNQLAADRARLRAAGEQTALRAKYSEALKNIERLEGEREAVLGLQDYAPTVIEPRFGSGTSEATLVVPASDWHLEERVDPRNINGLNEFNLEIADARVKTYFRAVVRLTRLLQQDVKIRTMLMPLLGDFVSGDIHEEISEVCQLPPMEAIGFAQDRIIGGIEFLLAHTSIEQFVFDCHSGNHARTTKTTRFGTENGHSIEYLMYRHLKGYFRHEPRVTVNVAEGPHSYATIYGKTIRFQHGHQIKYGGGIGGIYIPVNRAIGQWNKGLKADLDVFGHFHQQVDGNTFMCNGSLIGYNSFALSIKALFDEPKQTLFLVDKKRGRTCTWPILFA